MGNFVKDAKILIVDDEPDIRNVLSDILEDEGFAIFQAENAEQARQQFSKNQPDVVLLDIWMPDEDGLEVLKGWTKDNQLDTPVIMISGHGTLETAEEAVKIGAYDFLEKPLTTLKLLLTIDRAMQTAKLKKENKQLKVQLHNNHEIIGNSPATKELQRHIRLLGPTGSWVFITGESGSGKHLVARSIHHNSPRQDSAFVEMNLGAIPAESINVQFFGSEQGGNVVRGSFEEAKGGSLFIDEVLDLSLETQGKLLSALQDSRFLRVGGTEYVDLDVRVIAATSGDAEEAIAEGRFREDLYYRLNVIPIHVPPLRDRTEDIASLLQYHLKQVSKRDNVSIRSFSNKAVAFLTSYAWPGNVRELVNLIQRLLILNQGDEISLDEVKQALQQKIRTKSGDGDLSGYLNLDMRQAKEAFEKEYLKYHLDKVDGNVSVLAKKIGLERTHLYRKLKSLEINPKASK